MCGGSNGRICCTRRSASNAATNRDDALQEHALNVDLGETVEIGVGLGVTERIIDRDRAASAQRVEQLARRIADPGMSKGLEQRIAAGDVAEGRDIERHDEFSRVEGRRVRAADYRIVIVVFTTVSNLSETLTFARSAHDHAPAMPA